MTKAGKESNLNQSELLNDRGKTHGNWQIQANLCHDILQLLYNSPNGQYLSPTQSQSIFNIIQKISRIHCGNPNNLDHWADIAGYAELEIKAGIYNPMR